MHKYYMSEETEPEVPPEFVKVLSDFVSDLKSTFPEYTPLINKWWREKDKFNYIDNLEERNVAYEKSVQMSSRILFSFCKKKLPPRFFDILYQNESIFQEDSELDTEFFPHIHFKNLWQCDISIHTRETIWKYLQLMLFSVVGTLNNKEAFGDTAKLFEAINQDDFKDKLQETLSNMQSIFEKEGTTNQETTEHLPNAEQMHDHITGMLDGKLGQLAREIAEETASDLNTEFSDITDMKGVFDTLIKNPSKLMDLVKNVGKKIDDKIKSGEMNESDMIQEATNIMNKMKNVPGMDNIQSMLNKMGMNMGGMGGGAGNINTAAMENRLNQKMKIAKTKERILAKAEARANAKALEQMMKTIQPTPQNTMNIEDTLNFINGPTPSEKSTRKKK